MSKRKNLYVRTSKDALDKVIKEAKHNDQFFYIGVARDSGENALDAALNRDKSGHHADRGVKELHGLRLSRVNYTQFLKESSVCALETELIKKYEDDPLCQNKKQGQDDCITADRGIVYVRTYSPKKSTAEESPKKRGTTKGTTKGSTKGTTKGTIKETSKGTTKRTLKGPTKGTMKGTSKGTTKRTTKATTNGTTKGTSKGTKKCSK